MFMLHLVPATAATAPSPAFDATGTVATVADLLVDAMLPEPECRAIGARAAQALAQGAVAVPIAPEHLVFTPDGDLWLAGSPAHPSRRDDDRVGEIAATVIRCATGVHIDADATWDAPSLRSLGCSPDLAADLATVLTDRPPAIRGAGLLQRRDDRLPRPPGRDRPTVAPAIDLPSPAIAGLSPIGDRATRPEGGRAPRGWRDWARAGRARTRRGRAS
ncbi:MAG: hypothetical protein AAF548_18330 [Actinomycetota bacterium]